jgi:hypothetical protein
MAGPRRLQIPGSINDDGRTDITGHEPRPGGSDSSGLPSFRLEQPSLTLPDPARLSLGVPQIGTEFQSRYYAEEDYKKEINKAATEEYNKAIKRFQKKQRGRGRIKGTISAPTLDYWCGAQAQIFFGDTFVDEIFAFQVETMTNRAPLYGYASRHLDTVAEGNMLVSGTFAINFIHQNYLPITLAKIAGDRRRIGARADLAEEDRPADRLRDDSVMGRNVSAKNYEITFKNLSKFKQQQALNQIQNKGNEEFAALNDSVTSEKIARLERKNDPLVRDYDMPPFQNTGYFDIFATFRDPAQEGTGIPTLRRITDAVLLSQGMVVNATGEPILETYRFLARDII